jgi:hypothetical protein
MSPQDQFDQELQAAMDEIAEKNPLPLPATEERVGGLDLSQEPDLDPEMRQQALDVIARARGAIVLGWSPGQDDDGHEGIRLEGIVCASRGAAGALLGHLFSEHPDLLEQVVIDYMRRLLGGGGQ